MENNSEVKIVKVFANTESIPGIHFDQLFNLCQYYWDMQKELFFRAHEASSSLVTSRSPFMGQNHLWRSVSTGLVKKHRSVFGSTKTESGPSAYPCYHSKQLNDQTPPSISD